MLLQILVTVRKIKLISDNKKQSMSHKNLGSSKDFLDSGRQASIERLNTQAIGRYELLDKIGLGSMGVVYLARDPYIKRQVALKISRTPSELKGLEINKYREQFFMEAQSAGSLSHPNIVSIYDVGIHRDSCYITMEFIDGHTLEENCQPETLLPTKKLANLIYPICSALDYAHQKGVIHLDIKPANIMLSKSGEIKITDFGIAKMINDETLQTELAGSPSYMSPEQVKEETTDHLSDIFSLGCVVYELITGYKAFPGENHFSIMYKITHKDPVPLTQTRSGIPPVLDKVILKALEKNPEHRYQSAMDFAYALKQAVRTLEDDNAIELIGDDIVEYVLNVQFFDGFSREQVGEILEASEIVRIQADNVVVTEGDTDDCFYIVLSGRAAVHSKGKVLAVINKGECFGEMAFLTGETRAATVLATTDCTLIKISSMLLEKQPEEVQLLFLKRFSLTLLRRLSLSNIQLSN